MKQLTLDIQKIIETNIKILMAGRPRIYVIFQREYSKEMAKFAMLTQYHDRQWCFQEFGKNADIENNMLNTIVELGKYDHFDSIQDAIYRALTNDYEITCFDNWLDFGKWIVENLNEYN